MAERKIGNRELRPESLMMSYGYRPDWSEGAIKCPIFQTSTFVFKNAEDGKSFFELALGLRERKLGEADGLIYSRLNNPDFEVLEDRLTLWDGAEACAVFASGMAAISTTLLSLLEPGDALALSEPVYGGTDYFCKHVLTKFGIRVIGFRAGMDMDAIDETIKKKLGKHKLKMIFIETPANPTNDLIDIRGCADLAKSYSSDEHKTILAVDNTFLGPLWQHPIKHGADLVLYSATKYIGGHSDLIAGVCMGPAALLDPIRMMRTMMGTNSSPWTGWLILRSLETLKLRMTAQMKNAQQVANYLQSHPKVDRVYYLGSLDETDPQFETYRRQCRAPGGIISFDVCGGQKEAFRFLNTLKLIQLAVSLGGTESLAEHPATMTHSDVDPVELAAMGVSHKMCRISIGVEDPEDLIADIEQALEVV